MILLPAIDLVAGRCVRLVQGDFTRVTAYDLDPAAALAEFAQGGAREAHLVDLDGARSREPRQHGLFERLAEDASLTLQVAGGFRTLAQVARMLDCGITRVVLGSLAIEDPDAFDALLDRFGPDRLVLALDVRLDEGVPRVATHGWARDTRHPLDTVLGRFPAVRHLLVTDIDRDGMMNGPNIALTRTIATQYPAIALQASGGVADLADLDALRESGAARTIVGKAIWERRFTVAEGVAHAGS